MLRPEPDQHGRLREPRQPPARIIEAEREGRLVELEGLDVSLAGAQDELAQLDAEQARRSTAVDLGIPTLPDGTAAHLCSREALPYRCVRSPSRMSASMWGARSTGLDAARHNAPVSWRKSPGAASARMLPSFLPASRSWVIAAMTGP